MHQYNALDLRADRLRTRHHPRPFRLLARVTRPHRPTR